MGCKPEERPRPQRAGYARIGHAVCVPGSSWGPSVLLAILHGLVGGAFGGALYLASHYSLQAGWAPFESGALAGLVGGCTALGLTLTPVLIFLVRTYVASREFPPATGAGLEPTLKATFGTVREADQPTRNGLVILTATRLMYNAWNTSDAAQVPLGAIAGRDPFGARGIRVRLEGGRELELLVSLFQRRAWLAALDAALLGEPASGS
ncbi:MAG: hypothetical protein JKY65_29260 [Planctomycetes bacterium]|nr:hypothetical protein [Planctomycetota bacterium]